MLVYIACIVGGRLTLGLLKFSAVRHLLPIVETACCDCGWGRKFLEKGNIFETGMGAAGAPFSDRN